MRASLSTVDVDPEHVIAENVWVQRFAIRCRHAGAAAIDESVDICPERRLLSLRGRLPQVLELLSARAQLRYQFVRSDCPLTMGRERPRLGPALPGSANSAI